MISGSNGGISHGSSLTQEQATLANSLFMSREMPSSKGLAYDVTHLCEAYLDQGCIMNLDNLYRSTSLFVHLLDGKLSLVKQCTMMIVNSPLSGKTSPESKEQLKGTFTGCGAVMCCTYRQKAKCALNMMSTAHAANNHVTAKQKVKRGNQWTKIPIRKALLMVEYSKGMLGVDKPYQLMMSWGRALHGGRHCSSAALTLLSTASFLCQVHREDHPEIEISRKTGFDQLAFRIELAHQILGMEDRSAHPPYPPRKSEHKPQVQGKHRNCELCYKKYTVERKIVVFRELCDVYLCFILTRNCFGVWHAMQPH